MFTILTFIITSCYLFQSWGLNYDSFIHNIVVLLACIPAALADYHVVKEYLQKGDNGHKSRILNR